MATVSPPILVWTPGGGVPVGPASNPPVYSQKGITQLVVGQAYIDVVFGSIQTSVDWVLATCEVENTTDINPLNIWSGIITNRTTAGFRLQLNGMPDSGNYYLHWAVSGVNIAPTPASTYFLTGPVTGGISVASAVFTVNLPPSTTVSGTLTVTLNDSGAGGTFTPASVTLTTSSRTATFTYTPASYGAKTIAVTNSGGLIDPASLAFTSTAATYTLSGPSSGTSGVASTNFTVALPAGGVVVGTVTVTPSAGGGGTFTPSTVALTTAAPSATFTYTPSSAGTKTISVTNNGGLTNPGNLTYTSNPAVSVVMKDLFNDANGTVLTAHTMDIGSGWTKYEGTGGTDTQVQLNAAACPLDAGSAYAYISESGKFDSTIDAELAFGVATNAYFNFIVFRYSNSTNFWRLGLGGGGAGNIVLDKTVAGATTALDTDVLVFVAGEIIVVQLILSGSSVTASVTAAAGTVNLNATDAFNSTATKVGLRQYRSAGGSVVLHDITVTG